MLCLCFSRADWFLDDGVQQAFVEHSLLENGLVDMCSEQTSICKLARRDRIPHEVSCKQDKCLILLVSCSDWASIDKLLYLSHTESRRQIRLRTVLKDDYAVDRSKNKERRAMEVLKMENSIQG